MEDENQWMDAETDRRIREEIEHVTDTLMLAIKESDGEITIDELMKLVEAMRRGGKGEI